MLLVLVSLSFSLLLIKREADLTVRGEREVVSHGGVDFPSAGATKTFVRVYLDERSWLVGSCFVSFFFLPSRRQQCGMGEKNRRSKGRQRNLRSKMEK